MKYGIEISDNDLRAYSDVFRYFEMIGIAIIRKLYPADGCTWAA